MLPIGSVLRVLRGLLREAPAEGKILIIRVIDQTRRCSQRNSY